MSNLYKYKYTYQHCKNRKILANENKGSNNANIFETFSTFLFWSMFEAFVSKILSSNSSLPKLKSKFEIYCVANRQEVSNYKKMGFIKNKHKLSYWLAISTHWHFLGLVACIVLPVVPGFPYNLIPF